MTLNKVVLTISKNIPTLRRTLTTKKISFSWLRIIEESLKILEKEHWLHQLIVRRFSLQKLCFIVYFLLMVALT